MHINVETDEFTVSYDASIGGTERMLRAITQLGYRPRVVQSPLQRKVIEVAVPGAMPEPLASLLQEAAHSDRPVFLNFHATWCGACQTMEKTTLVDPAVRAMLSRFQVLAVDADSYPEAVQYLRVYGMPTYIVLGPNGVERYRQVGPISADQLLLDLARVHASNPPLERKQRSH